MPADAAGRFEVLAARFRHWMQGDVIPLEEREVERLVRIGAVRPAGGDRSKRAVDSGPVKPTVAEAGMPAEATPPPAPDTPTSTVQAKDK